MAPGNLDEPDVAVVFVMGMDSDSSNGDEGVDDAHPGFELAILLGMRVQVSLLSLTKIPMEVLGLTMLAAL